MGNYQAALTFRAAEGHDEGRVGLVEGGKRRLASLVPDGGQLVKDVRLQGLLLRAAGLHTQVLVSFVTGLV